eukprot:TRINITY_DN12175_c0_g1_i1.p1 TRINITY_DN12175_c0_g1~~TRINITY_DN12175_c0_g1_i1.p1  ORF type:complete len:239 (+),score=53.55 TRINITY_DN12175_c0_g1_i1:55-771(+)
MRGKAALFFLIVFTIFYIATFCVPWWYWKNDQRNLGGHQVICWLDATCRSDGFIFKGGFGAQRFYDASLIIMCLSLVPYLLMAHSIFALKSKAYESSIWRPIGLLSWFLLFLMLLAVALLFPLGLTNTYSIADFTIHTPNGREGVSINEIDHPYGNKKLTRGDRIKWGLFVGFYLEIFSAFVLLFIPPFLFAMKNNIIKKDKDAGSMIHNRRYFDMECIDQRTQPVYCLLYTSDAADD